MVVTREQFELGVDDCSSFFSASEQLAKNTHSSRADRASSDSDSHTVISANYTVVRNGCNAESHLFCT